MFLTMLSGKAVELEKAFARKFISFVKRKAQSRAGFPLGDECCAIRQHIRCAKKLVATKAAFTLKACFCVHAFACVNALLFAFSCSD